MQRVTGRLLRMWCGGVGALLVGSLGGCESTAEFLLQDRTPGWGSGQAALTIGPGEDPAAKLGVPAWQREQGEPLPLDAELAAKLADVHTNPGRLPQLQVEHQGRRYDLPLRHTAVDATVTGGVARVEIAQHYRNPFSFPIETIYVFPLPENSAVGTLRMVIGDRVIESEVQHREMARQTYDQAKQAGHTTALLEQERPNVFTQRVANIEANSEIDIVVGYVQDLVYDAGQYEFVFPLVVGPRFVPGTPIPGRTGTGWARDTDEVPDASRISPPLVGGGMRTGHNISVNLRLEPGLPIASWESLTHEVLAESLPDQGVGFRLAERDSVPNRDFVLRYRVATPEPQARVLSHWSGEQGGYFSLVLQPPELPVEALVGRREFLFVVDVSGSMHGVPLGLCQVALQQLLTRLRPVDTFDIFTFSGGQQRLFSAMRPADTDSIRQAGEFIQGLQAGGGTLMRDAVSQALADPPRPGYRRNVLFMTDGYVGNEEGILQELAARMETHRLAKADVRVFSFGVGSSPNRFLIDGLAQQGRGLALYLSNSEEPDRAVDRVFGLVDAPVLTDLQLDWGGLPVSDLVPARLPDLFASRPIWLHGRFKQPATGRAVLTGQRDGREFRLELPVTLDGTQARPVLATLWARARIGELQAHQLLGGSQQAPITELGLQYHLVTPYTSLVAVDRSRKVDNGDPATVVQPGDGPEDVDLSRVGGEVPEWMKTRGRAGGVPAQRVMGDGKGMMLQRIRSTGALSAEACGRGAACSPAPGGQSDGLRVLLGAPSPANTPAGFGGLGLSGTRPGRLATNGRGVGELGDRSGGVPQLTAGRPQVTGALDREIVRRIIGKHRDEIKFCYEQVLREQPGLTGKVVVAFTILPSGAIGAVTIRESTLKHPKMEQCMLTRIKKWVFPQPAGGGQVEVVYPFIFKTI